MSAAPHDDWPYRELPDVFNRDPLLAQAAGGIDPRTLCLVAVAMELGYTPKASAQSRMGKRSILLISPLKSQGSIGIHPIEVPAMKDLPAKKRDAIKRSILTFGDPNKVRTFQTYLERKRERHDEPAAAKPAPLPSPPVTLASNPAVTLKAEPTVTLSSTPVTVTPIVTPPVTRDITPPVTGPVTRPVTRAEPTVVAFYPAEARFSTGKGRAGRPYRSPSTCYREWSDGRVDYVCSAKDCTYWRHNDLDRGGIKPHPRSGDYAEHPLQAVKSHFGKQHGDIHGDTRTVERWFPDVPFATEEVAIKPKKPKQPKPVVVETKAAEPEPAPVPPGDGPVFDAFVEGIRSVVEPVLHALTSKLADEVDTLKKLLIEGDHERDELTAKLAAQAAELTELRAFHDGVQALQRGAK